MTDYHLVVHQRVRYSLNVEADTPQAAAAHVATGIWDDSNSEVFDDRVQVHDANGAVLYDSATDARPDMLDVLADLARDAPDLCVRRPRRPRCCETAREADQPLRGTDHDETCDNYDGAPDFRDGMGPDDPVRCAND